VLAERADEIFEGDQDSPFMLLAKRVTPEWLDKIPAIVHVDGTARVQTVRREHNERLYLLLKEFEKLTGVPVLLNTSFNIRGEPIVETPADAVRCFLSTGIDHLALHDMLIAKSPYYRVLYPIMKWGSDVATMVKIGIGAEPKQPGAD
jgi:carbamoyltransferase